MRAESLRAREEQELLERVELPVELVALAWRVSSEIEGSRRHDELVNQLATGISEYAERRATEDLDRALEDPEPKRELSYAEILRGVEDGSFQLEPWKSPSPRWDTAFSLWHLENLYVDTLGALQVLHARRREIEDMIMEVNDPLEESYTSILPLAGRKALEYYYRSLIRFAKHLRDVGMLARLPAVPGRPPGRELAAVQVGTSVLSDMIILDVSRKNYLTAIKRAHALRLGASDPERAYMLSAPGAAGDRVRLKWFSSYVLQVAPAAVQRIFDKSGEVYPDAEKGRSGRASEG